MRAVAAGEQPTDGDALVSLERDGLVVLRDGTVSLPVLAERQERALVLEEEALQLEAAAETRQRAVDPITRWHGSTSGSGFWPFAAPTARAESGPSSSRRACSP